MLHRAPCPQAAHMPCLYTQGNSCVQHSRVYGSLTNMICWLCMIEQVEHAATLALPQAAATRCCAVYHADNRLTGRYYAMTARCFWQLQKHFDPASGAACVLPTTCTGQGYDQEKISHAAGWGQQASCIKLLACSHHSATGAVSSRFAPGTQHAPAASP